MLGDLGKLSVAKGFKKLPKAQKSPDLVTLVMKLFVIGMWRFISAQVVSSCVYAKSQK